MNALVFSLSSSIFSALSLSFSLVDLGVKGVLHFPDDGDKRCTLLVFKIQVSYEPVLGPSVNIGPLKNLKPLYVLSNSIVSYFPSRVGSVGLNVPLIK